jgi:glycine betaine/proline transport system ATP-binding protein
MKAPARLRDAWPGRDPETVTAAAMTAQPKLVCHKVWKLFGDGAAQWLSGAPQDPTNEDIAAAGLVGAVRNVNIEVRTGEIFVIMGLSGSGKSTLVRCLSRLVEPTSGEIHFNGENLLTASDARMIEIRRHSMGMVFQHFALLPHLTVQENVAFPLDIQGVSKAKSAQRARAMIELVGLAGRESAYPRQLSGGQQQRVGIARSLAVEPELWFLDEPFSALDPLIRREMQDEFLRLQSMLHKTIVFITHDFDEAIRLADRIAIMKDGEIVQAGTPEDIVLNPATPYVAEFTRSVAKAKVVKAESLMVPAKGRLPERTVSASDKIAAIAPLFTAGVDRLNVIGEDGASAGILLRDDVVAMMLRG